MNVGNTLAATTIRNIPPARSRARVPLRKPKIAWKIFLKTHWSSLAAADFFQRRGLDLTRPDHVLQAVRDRSRLTRGPYAGTFPPQTGSS
jgi:hypothetical protein